jgi:hypothetical protein
MELLERYLQAVRFWLPRRQQQDITAELRDDIQSQIEEEAAALGRPVNEDELVGILRKTGHPIEVAARYQPRQSLIGPALFPLYKFVLKIVGLCYLGPWVLVWQAMMLSLPSYRAQHLGAAMLGTWGYFWSMAFSLFGVITLIFALLERFQSRFAAFKKWDPRKLPRVVQPKQRVSRVESVFGLVFSIIFVTWWLGLPRFGYLMFGPVAADFSWNPALRSYYWLVLLPALIVMAQQCVNLFRPQWIWLRAAALLAADCITLGILASIGRVHPFVILADGAKNAGRYAQVLPVLNQVGVWSVLVAAVCVGIALLVHAFQTLQAVRRMGLGPHDAAPMQMSQML